MSKKIPTNIPSKYQEAISTFVNTEFKHISKLNTSTDKLIKITQTEEIQKLPQPVQKQLFQVLAELADINGDSIQNLSLFLEDLEE